MLAANARTEPRGEHLTNIGLDRKGLLGVNALAYFSRASMVKKSKVW
jgi:hypothetical protein